MNFQNFRIKMIKLFILYLISFIRNIVIKYNIFYKKNIEIEI